MPVSVDPTAQMFRPVGSASSRSRDRTCCCVALFTSTIGDAPVTVTVSSIAPTFRSAFTVAVKPAGSSMPARLTTLKPATVKPGSTAPVASFTTPAMALCASARSGNNASMANPASTTTATLLLTIIASQRGPQNDRECDSPRIAVESEPGSGRQAHGDDDDDRARLALYGEQRIATHMRCVRFCEKATPADGVSQRPGGADR